MILYLAAIYTNGMSFHGQIYRRFTDIEKRARDGVKYILESYHYVHKQKDVDAMRRDGAKVFLDSGAFSAFTQNVTINLEEYCDYIRRNADILTISSVLDGIGDPLQTYRNQQAMEAHGVQALPCFHYGEDPCYLEHYVANYPYITLGGMVPINREQLTYWLDDIWGKYLTDSEGMPKLKVHGFGLTRVGLMERYPWHSVDSSSWVQSAGRGGIMIPGHGTVFISDNSPVAKEEGRHFNTISPIEREVIQTAIESRGFDIQRLRQTYLARWTFNMLTYGELTNPDATPKPFKIKQKTFF